jgi:large subunit ribosomal protein L10
MALTRDQKGAQLQSFKDALKKAKSVVFMQYAGTSVEAISALRGKLYERKAEMKVGKKTLFRIAAKEAGLPDVTDEATPGPIAYVYSYEDEMSGAKVALEFRKVSDKVALVGGILNGKILSKAEAVELGKMLSKEELLAKFAAMLRAPLSNFASIASSPLRSFAYATAQVAEKKPAG